MNSVIKVLNNNYNLNDRCDGCHLLVIANKAEIMLLERELNNYLVRKHNDRFFIYLIDAFNNLSLAGALAQRIGSHMELSSNAVFRSDAYESGFSESFASYYWQNPHLEWQKLEAYLNKMMG